MDKLKNKAARRYLRQVRHLLPCSRAVKDEITAPLVQSLDAFLTEQPQANIEALRDHFGAPETIAASCLENTDTGEVLKRLQWKRRILAIAAAAVASVLISWAVFQQIYYLDLKHTVLDGYQTTEIGVIEVIELPDGTMPPSP